MDGRLLFKACTLLHTDGRLQGDMSLSVRGGRIEAVAPDAQLPILPGDWVIDAGGRVLAPGLVDAHAPLIERGLVAGIGALPPERLSQLAARLTAGEREALAAHGLSEGLLRGITSRVCRLHVPDAPADHLQAVTRAAERVGARAVLCVAPASGDGAGPLLEQLLAAVELAQVQRQHRHLRVGLGWRGALPDEEALRTGLLSLLQGASVPVLIADAPGGAELLPHLRALAEHGWLAEGTLFALEAALPADAAAALTALVQSGALVAVNAEAAVDVVRRGPAEAVERLTGMGEGPMGTLSRVGRALEGLGHTGAGMDASAQRRVLLQAGQVWLSARFGARIGLLEVGAAADLVLYDWVPSARNREGALWDRLHQRVSWVVVEGRVAVREGGLLGHQSVELAQAAARACEAVADRAEA